ncbi:MAG: hypothetical protein EBZ59_06885, partial [Planctomycetia bacterium]|nr:hypothetical protein [Planctomycetia bacterium]
MNPPAHSPIEPPAAAGASAGGPLHLILCAVGSSGDGHPFVGLGRALVRRGHRVTLVTAGYFRGLVEEAGLEFVDP